MGLWAACSSGLLASCVLWQGRCEWLPDTRVPRGPDACVGSQALEGWGPCSCFVLEEGFPSLGTCRSPGSLPRPPEAQGLGWWDGSVQEGIAGVSLPSWDLCFHSVPRFRASPCTGCVGVGCRVRLSVLSRFRELASSGLHAHLFFRSHQWLWGCAGRAGAGRRPGEDRCAAPPLRLRVQHLLQQQPALRRQVGPGCACSPLPALWSSQVGKTPCES